MKVEGIIIHKTPYKDRDLICNLLLRSGKKISVYFYGGRGGGKSSKGSILELGYMVSIELNPKKKKLDTELLMAKEYSLLWSGQSIRKEYQAFYLSMFYLEFIAKVAVEDELEGHSDDHHEGLFNVLSNALFFLNNSLEENQFSLQNQLFFFFSKLSVQLGISIDIDLCMFCAVELKKNLCLFDPQNGGFICRDCASKSDEFLSEDNLLRLEYQSSTKLRDVLSKVYRIPYKQYCEIPNLPQGLTVAQFNYINLQFGFTKESFRSWGMISSF